jgi:hypothetical protein
VVDEGEKKEVARRWNQSPNTSSGDMDVTIGSSNPTVLKVKPCHKSLYLLLVHNEMCLFMLCLRFQIPP